MSILSAILGFVFGWLFKAFCAWDTPDPKHEPRCTGVTASWCPRCGDCECPGRGDRHLDDPCCPLHGTFSAHGE